MQKDSCGFPTTMMKKKQKPNCILFTRMHLKYKTTERLKVKEQKNIYHANTNQKKTSIAILIPDKVGFKAPRIIRDF